MKVFLLQPKALAWFFFSVYRDVDFTVLFISYVYICLYVFCTGCFVCKADSSLAGLSNLCMQIEVP